MDGLGAECLLSTHQTQGLSHSTEKEEEQVGKVEKSVEEERRTGNRKRRRGGRKIILKRHQRMSKQPCHIDVSNSLLGRVGMVLGTKAA